MLIREEPIIPQLRKMLEFCERFDEIYIYGEAAIQKMISKYLCQCGFDVKGYLISNGQRRLNDRTFFLSHVTQKLTDGKDVGIIIGLSDIYYNEVISALHDNGISMKRVFFPTEFLKHVLEKKMSPIKKDDFHVEINLADHCNLNCQMCDHFAQLAPKKFLRIDEFKNVVHRLAELTEHKIGTLMLHGGEPTLNDRLCDFIKIAREEFPDSWISIYTNGLLLKQWENHNGNNLWKICNEYNVRIELTVYPIELKLDEIRQLAEKYEVELITFTETWDREKLECKISWKFPFNHLPEKNLCFASCRHFNECITLRDGKLYTCPIIPYSEFYYQYFGITVNRPTQDGVDIYQAKDYEEIAERMTHKADFCDMCDLEGRKEYPWKRTEYSLLEYMAEAKEEA